MPLAHSKLTAQGQISVPAKVRQKLGLSPGAVIEWEEENGAIVVRRVGKYSSEDIHRAIFAKKPRRRSLKELKQGIAKYIRQRHARR